MGDRPRVSNETLDWRIRAMNIVIDTSDSNRYQPFWERNLDVLHDLQDEREQNRQLRNQLGITANCGECPGCQYEAEHALAGEFLHPVEELMAASAGSLRTDH